MYAREQMVRALGYEYSFETREDMEKYSILTDKELFIITYPYEQPIDMPDESDCIVSVFSYPDRELLLSDIFCFEHVIEGIEKLKTMSYE